MPRLILCAKMEPSVQTELKCSRNKHALARAHTRRHAQANAHACMCAGMYAVPVNGHPNPINTKICPLLMQDQNVKRWWQDGRDLLCCKAEGC